MKAVTQMPVFTPVIIAVTFESQSEIDNLCYTIGESSTGHELYKILLKLVSNDYDATKF